MGEWEHRAASFPVPLFTLALAPKSIRHWLSQGWAGFVREAQGWRVSSGHPQAGKLDEASGSNGSQEGHPED